MATLCQRLTTAGEIPPTVPKITKLTKLTPDNDVDAYLDLFELTPEKNGLQPTELESFASTSGEAQQACQVPSAAKLANYATFKAAILAHYRYNLPGLAQRFHTWNYDPAQPARTQVVSPASLEFGSPEGMGLLYRGWFWTAVFERCPQMPRSIMGRTTHRDRDRTRGSSGGVFPELPPS